MSDRILVYRYDDEIEWKEWTDPTEEDRDLETWTLDTIFNLQFKIIEVGK